MLGPPRPPKALFSQVEYQCEGFLEKNRDTVYEEQINILKASQVGTRSGTRTRTGSVSVCDQPLSLSVSAGR